MDTHWEHGTYLLIDVNPEETVVHTWWRRYHRLCWKTLLLERRIQWLQFYKDQNEVAYCALEGLIEAAENFAFLIGDLNGGGTWIGN